MRNYQANLILCNKSECGLWWNITLYTDATVFVISGLLRNFSYWVFNTVVGIGNTWMFSTDEHLLFGLPKSMWMCIVIHWQKGVHRLNGTWLLPIMKNPLKEISSIHVAKKSISVRIFLIISTHNINKEHL